MCLGLMGAKRLRLSQGSVVGSEPCVVGKLPFSRFLHTYTSSIFPLAILRFHGDDMSGQDKDFQAHCSSERNPYLLHLSGSAHLEDLSREAIIGSEDRPRADFRLGERHLELSAQDLVRGLFWVDAAEQRHLRPVPLRG